MGSETTECVVIGTAGEAPRRSWSGGELIVPGVYPVNSGLSVTWLVVIALDHVAVGITLSNNRAQYVRVDLGDRRVGDYGRRQAEANQQHAALPGA